jgi:hypothetical protein
MACPGFLTAADTKGDVGATRDLLQLKLRPKK